MSVSHWEVVCFYGMRYGVNFIFYHIGTTPFIEKIAPSTLLCQLCYVLSVHAHGGLLLDSPPHATVCLRASTTPSSRPKGIVGLDTQ